MKLFGQAQRPPKVPPAVTDPFEGKPVCVRCVHYDGSPWCGMEREARPDFVKGVSEGVNRSMCALKNGHGQCQDFSPLHG